MSDQQRKGSTSVTELPNPDLNPLLNPTLGRNLGRWAEVYFTTPPERRQEAVEELLRELEGTPGTDAPDARGQIAELKSPPLPAEDPGSAQICPDCGQGYEVPQRYCGMCGAPLLARRSQLERQPLVQAMPAATGPETAPMRVPLARSLAGFDSAVADAESASDEISEVRWLREKRRGVEDSALYAPSSATRRIATVALALFAIAGLVYMQSRPKKAQVRPSVSAPQERLPAAGRSAAESNEAKQASDPAISEVPQALSMPSKSLSTPTAGDRTGAAIQRTSREPSKLQPTPVSASADPAAAASANPGNGSIELAQAEDYLNGKNGSRDPATAARLLWASVGKENTSAILLLSDMYMIGDGVPKSCDQAKVLLYVAARKHVVQAADKLRNLEQSGCP